MRLVRVLSYNMYVNIRSTRDRGIQGQSADDARGCPLARHGIWSPRGAGRRRRRHLDAVAGPDHVDEVEDRGSARRARAGGAREAAVQGGVRACARAEPADVAWGGQGL